MSKENDKKATFRLAQQLHDRTDRITPDTNGLTDEYDDIPMTSQDYQALVDSVTEAMKLVDEQVGIFSVQNRDSTYDKENPPIAKGYFTVFFPRGSQGMLCNSCLTGEELGKAATAALGRFISSEIHDHEELQAMPKQMAAAAVSARIAARAYELFSKGQV